MTLLLSAWSTKHCRDSESRVLLQSSEIRIFMLITFSYDAYAIKIGDQRGQTHWTEDRGSTASPRTQSVHIVFGLSVLVPLGARPVMVASVILRLAHDVRAILRLC